MPEGGSCTVVGVAKPVAPLKIPAPPTIVIVSETAEHVKVCPGECVVSPVEGGGEIKRYRHGTKSPEGKIANVTVPVSE